MESSQVALKLLLDALDMQISIQTVDERKSVQKAVYLGQAAGVDLGYRYNWYVMGPYSPSLTRDYYALNAWAKDDSSHSRRLKPSIVSRLENVKPVLTPPEDVDLSRSNWLELVASLHYLLRQRRLGLDDAKAMLKKEKSHVSAYADTAYAILEEAELI